MASQNDQSTRINIDENPSQQSDSGCKFKNCFKRKIWIFPFLVFILLFAVSIIPYVVSLNEGLIYPVLPYVSDAGASHPVAAFFSIIFLIMSICIAISNWGRYKQIEFYLAKSIPTSGQKYDERTIQNLRKFNFYSIICTFFAVFGIHCVTSFRSIEYFGFHIIGAVVAASGIVTYTLFQVYLCQKLYELNEIESRPTSLRIVIIISIISLTLCFTFSILSFIYRDPNIEWTDQKRLVWSPEMGGYQVHLAATITEWIALLLPSLFMLGISRRMRLFKHWDQIQF